MWYQTFEGIKCLRGQSFGNLSKSQKTRREVPFGLQCAKLLVRLASQWSPPSKALEVRPEREGWAMEDLHSGTLAWHLAVILL